MRLLTIIVVVGSLAGAGWKWGPGLWAKWSAGDESVKDVEARFHTVEARPLVIDFTANGSLEARQHHQVNFNLKSQTQATILSVVEQGTEVKKGDELMRLDPQPILDKIKVKEKELEASREGVPLSESWLKVEKSIADSSVTGAQELLQKSIDGLKKFRQWDAPNEFKKLDDQISAAVEAKEEAIKAYRDARAAADEISFGDDEKRDAAEKAAISAKKKVEAASENVDRTELQKRIYQTYNYPDQLKAMEQAAVKGKLDLEKARLTTRADIEKAESALAVARQEVTKVEKELAEWREDLKNVVLLAPADGIVLYGGRQREGKELKVGGIAYRGLLMTIPQFGDYKINIEVGEHIRPRLKVNARTILTFEAIKGVALEGKLASISRYASKKRSWDPNSPRVFRGVVELDGSDERLISGLTAKVRIIVEEIPSCLTLPIETVFNEDGEAVCYVRTPDGPERRAVATGRSNDDYVEVTEGVVAGEQVYCDNPMETPGEPSASSKTSDASSVVNGN